MNLPASQAPSPFTRVRVGGWLGVRGKLLAAFGAVVAIQVIAGAVTLQSTNRFDGLLDLVTERYLQSDAATEMEVGAVEAGFAIMNLLQSGDKRYTPRYHDAVRRFWVAHSSYRDNARTAQEKDWAAQTERLFLNYSVLAGELIGLENYRDATFVRLSNLGAELESLIRKTPIFSESADRGLGRAVLRLQHELIEMLLMTLANGGEESHKASLPKLREILAEAEDILKQFPRLNLSAPGRAWSNRFAGVVAEMAPRIERLAGYRVEIDERVRKFVELRRQLDDILDVGIQVDSSKDLTAARTAQNDAVYAISRETLALGFAAIVMATLAVIALSRTLIWPLGALSGAAEKLSDGDFSARVAVAGKDEIAVLGTVFNNMAAAVQRNQAALRDANRGLEEKVAARTRDIEETNRRLLKELEGRARVEEDLRTAMSTAEAASRAKSGFLANMSHELRTPLNAVIGFAEVISQQLHGKLDNPRYLDYAQYIHQSGSHLLRLINDILDLSRIEAGRIDLAEEEVDVAAVVDEVVNLLRQQAANAELEIETSVPGQLPGLHADGGRLRQILVNLIANAIKFTKPGGRVSVRAGLGPAPEGRFEIIVADTGIGIPEDKIEVALSTFGRIDNGLLREGTGLGLPLTKKLAELHGGGLELESQAGKGTTVTVWFPASRVLDGAAAAAARKKTQLARV